MSAFIQILKREMHLAADVGHEQVEIAIGVEILTRDTHAGDRNTPAVIRTPVECGDVLEGPIAIVVPEERWSLVVGNIYITPAVSIKVRRQHAQTVANFVRDARRFRDVLEPPGADVAIELVARGRLVDRWAAIVADAENRVTHRLALHAPSHIVGEVQVEASVAVVVEERRAGSEAGIGDTCIVGNLGKPSFALVSQQRVWAES